VCVCVCGEARQAIVDVALELGALGESTWNLPPPAPGAPPQLTRIDLHVVVVVVVVVLVFVVVTTKRAVKTQVRVVLRGGVVQLRQRGQTQRRVPRASRAT
jgi:hypothetical protein